MITDKTSSHRPVSGALPASVKSAPVTYISENDPRAKDKRYLRDFPGTIVVLSALEFTNWLKSQLPPGSNDPSAGISTTGPATNDSELTTSYASTFDISPPTNLSCKTSDAIYINSDSGILVNLPIVFDISPNDPNDGSYTYHVYYEPAVLSSATPLTPTAVLTSAGVSNLSSVSHSIYQIKAKWSQLPNAVSYHVKMSGINVPPTYGQGFNTFVLKSTGQPYDVYLNQSVGTVGAGTSKGYYIFEIDAAYSGSTLQTFSGSYTIEVIAMFKDGSISTPTSFTWGSI